MQYENGFWRDRNFEEMWYVTRWKNFVWYIAGEETFILCDMSHLQDTCPPCNVFSLKHTFSTTQCIPRFNPFCLQHIALLQTFLHRDKGKFLRELLCILLLITFFKYFFICDVSHWSKFSFTSHIVLIYFFPWHITWTQIFLSPYVSHKLFLGVQCILLT